MNRWLAFGILLVAAGFESIPNRAEAEGPAAPPVIVVDQAPPPATQPGYGQPAYDPNAQPGYGQPQPGYDPNAQPAYGQPQPGYDASAQAAYAQPVVAPPADRMRIRYGGSVVGGATFLTGGTGAASSFVFGGAGRIGVQFNDMWGVYLNEVGLIGAYVQADPFTAATRTIVFAEATTSVVGSVTFADRLELAVGPSIDALSAFSVKTFASGASVAAFQGTAIGLHLRAALMLGSRNPMTGGRSGFSLSVEAHPTFFDGATLMTLSLGLGADWY